MLETIYNVEMLTHEYSFKKVAIDIRGQSDKYLALPPDGVTIARKKYYSVEHFHRRQLSNFLSNRTRSIVLTKCGSGRVKEF